MYKLSKKEADSIQQSLSKFQKVLELAKSRDLNESDTVSIIMDILAEVFGYDKYLEITSELAIRGTYCDLAIKLNDKIEYLIECKSIGTTLKDSHVKQAIDYGANKGINWVILTNGSVWKLFKISFAQPISFDLVYEFDLTTLSPRADESKELLYILHKNAIEKNYRQVHFEKSKLVNPHTIAQLLLTETLTAAIRKEVRKLADDIKLGDDEILSILTGSVIKRDLIESEEAKDAAKLVRKCLKSSEKKAVVRIKKNPVPPADIKPEEQTLGQEQPPQE